VSDGTLVVIPRLPKRVSIGGQELSLIYNMRAVVLYKQKTGDSLFAAASLNSIGPAVDPDKFLWCLWAGLQTEHPDITRDFLELHINFDQAADLLRAMVDAIAGDFPEPKPATGNPPEPETAPARWPPEPIETL